MEFKTKIKKSLTKYKDIAIINTLSVIAEKMWRVSQVVRLRSATPSSPVRIWYSPFKDQRFGPFFILKVHVDMKLIILSFSQGAGRTFL